MIITTGSAEFDRALLSILSTGIIAWLGRKLRPKADVRWFQFHRFSFAVPGAPQAPAFLVHTATLRIENWGREAAKNVEVIHSGPPQIFKIWPPVTYEDAVTKEGFHIIAVKNLAPLEAFSIEFLSSTADLPMFVRARSDEGEAKEGRFTIQRYIPRWVQITSIGLALIGVAAIIYVLLSVISRFLPT